MLEDLKKAVEKLQYQVKLLGESLDFETNPIAALIIELDWNEEDLSNANDIFEKYDKKLENGEKVNWKEFEFELRDRFKLGYQAVKLVILAFFYNDQWTDICENYACENECMEFHVITKSHS